MALNKLTCYTIFRISKVKIINIKLNPTNFLIKCLLNMSTKQYKATIEIILVTTFYKDILLSIFSFYHYENDVFEKYR